MKTSETLDKLAPALAKAQSEMVGATKDTRNDFFKSKYADLTSVWTACKDALHSNGFSVVQSPVNDNGRIGVTTLLLHSSGQFITDSYTIGVKKENDPQADGSSITYARRYALAAFVGVCPVDDDAEGAMERGKKEDIKPVKNKQVKKEKATFEIPTEFQENYDILLKQLNALGDYEDAMEWINDNKRSFPLMLGGNDSPAINVFRNYTVKYLASLKGDK